MPKGLLLLSGGIDSPVAGQLAVQNGTELLAVHFPTEKITGKESIQKCLLLSKKLGIKKLFVCDLSGPFGEISNKCEHKKYFVLTKRLMLFIAQKIAIKHHAVFLVTGENLGQVSSQTLSNLSVIDKAVEMPVIRPLLCLEKVQIVELARKIGTLDASLGKEICDALGPKHPATKTSLQEILEEEKKIDAEKLIADALEKIQIYDFVVDPVSGIEGLLSDVKTSSVELQHSVGKIIEKHFDKIKEIKRIEP